MRFLFKTTLVHLQKNLPVVSVLGFFVGSGTTILSSVDNLSSNLNKGFSNINFDSNPHDIVLVTKGLRPTQSLKIDPTYVIGLSELEFEPGWGYKFSFNNTKQVSYIKSSDASKANINNSGTGSSKVLKHNETSILHFPALTNMNRLHYNSLIQCSDSTTPIPEIAKSLEFTDINKNSFNPKASSNTKIFDESKLDLDILKVSCKDNYLFSSKLMAYDAYFRELYLEFQQLPSYTDDSSKPLREYSLTTEEIHDLHKQKSAFNPYKLWRHTLNSSSGLYGFRPFIEEDFYFKTKILFKNNLANKDISKQFADLINKIKNSPVFYKLDSVVKSNIIAFENFGLLKDQPVEFYLSSLVDDLNTWNVWIPMVKGMDYKQTLIFLIKLFLWNFFSSNESGKSKIEERLKWNDSSTKTQLKELVSKFTGGEKGLEDWKPFEKVETSDGSSDIKKPTDPIKYLFSVLFPQKKLSDLNDDSNVIRDYQGSDTSGGTLSGESYLKDKTSNKLIEVWKEILEKWIDGSYKTPTSSDQSKIIPSFNKDSDKNYSTDKNKSNFNKKPFDKSESVNLYYREYPDSINEVYTTIINNVITSLKNYLSFLQLNSIKAVKRFIDTHELFTLSFLLQNFQYSPGQPYIPTAQRDSKIKKTSEQVQQSVAKTATDDDPYSPSINYHKSIVVVNPSNISAKLNESKPNHSFKIITQQTLDNSSINRLKIVSGNPLIKSSVDYETLFRALDSSNRGKREDKKIPTYELRDIYKTLARAKYSQSPTDFNKFWRNLYNYFSGKTLDAWNLKNWVSQEETLLFAYYSDQFDRIMKIQGSRVYFDFVNTEILKFSRVMNIKQPVETIWSTGYVDQLSSYFALVSPYYAKINNITPIPDEKYEEFKKIVQEDTILQSDWEKIYAAFILNPDNHNHILNVNGNKLIVVGTALTPDMMFPSHSWLSLVPNKSSEALVYVDKYGFNHLKNNSLSVWDEHYLSIGYPQEVKNLNKESEYKLQLTQYMNDFIFNDPDSDDDDNNEFYMKPIGDVSKKDLVFVRSSYVTSFLSSVNLISYSLLTFVGAIILFTVWILIKKYVSSNLSTFGVFVANGINRTTIMLNALSFIFIPSTIGVVIGYIFSLAVQPLVFGLFSDIWYLPPIFNGFNIAALFHYLLIFTSVLGLISLIASWFLMKNSTSDMMKVDMAFKQNKFVKYTYTLLGNVSSLWKFRISVILNSITKGFVLSSATVFLFLFSNFSFNNLGQFSKISDLEIKGKNYGFDLEFETPTDQSGQYLLNSYYNLGETVFDTTNHTKKVIYKENGQYKTEDIKYDKSNPEVISSGIYSPYRMDETMQTLMSQCSNKQYQWWEKKLGILNPDMPNRLFRKNPYGVYMFNSTVQEKSSNNKDNKDSQSSFCSTENHISTTHKQDEFALPAPRLTTSHMFYSGEQNSKFSPDTEISDEKKMNLGSYIPIKNESVSANTEPTVEKYGSEPLFKPLIDYYKKKKEAKKADSSQKEFLKEVNKQPEKSTKNGLIKYKDDSGDFIKIGNDEHPSIGKLFKDHSNYWLFSYGDLSDIVSDPIFFKNRVILPILFNHNWTFNLFGKSITANPWNEFKEFFSKYSSELMASMDDNFVNFVESMIYSRYGEYFVNRFMTKHKSTINDQNILPGQVLLNKKTWKVEKARMKKEAARKELYRNNESGTIDESNIKEQEMEVEDGLYWFDSSKIIHFWDKFSILDQASSANTQSTKTDENIDQHPERFIIFRPDFLYLIYAVYKDPVFLKHSVAPTKIVFNQISYISDYDKGFLDEISYDGDSDVDADKKQGITSEIKKTDTMSQSEYEAIPNGDQTYTYLKGNIDYPYIENLKIFGIKQDKRGSYIRLLDTEGNLINHKLYQSPTTSGSQKVYPVIVNKFAAKKLNLEIGKQFQYTVKNKKDRFTKYMSNQAAESKITFKVADIAESYYKTSIFISQKNANEILGLDPDYGFNGILTKRQINKEEMPIQLTSAISGFSVSGLYAKQQIHKSAADFQTFLGETSIKVDNLPILKNHKFVQPQNWEWFALKHGFTKDQGWTSPENVATNLSHAFGDGMTIISALSSIDNASVFNDFIFSTAADLILSIVNLFIIVLAPLLICSLGIITTIIIEDLKNLLTILNLLGFTYMENSVTILLYLGLVLGFSTLISLPITSSLLALYVEGIFSTLNIFLPIGLRVDYVLCSVAILLSIFGFAYLRVVKKIKKLYLPVAMKTLNE